MMFFLRACCLTPTVEAAKTRKIDMEMETEVKMSSNQELHQVLVLEVAFIKKVA